MAKTCTDPVAPLATQVELCHEGQVADCLRWEVAAGKPLFDGEHLATMGGGPLATTVRLKAGITYLGTSWLLDGRCLPSALQSIHIQGAGADKTILTGSLPVSVGKRLDSDISEIKLPDGVAMPDVPEREGPGIPLMFADNKALQLSRWPIDEWARIRNVRRFKYPTETSTFAVVPTPGRDLEAGLKNIWVRGFFANEWHDDVRSLYKSDADSYYVKGSLLYGIADGHRVRFENVWPQPGASHTFAMRTGSTGATAYVSGLKGGESIRVAVQSVPLIVVRNVHGLSMEKLGVRQSRGVGILIQDDRDVTLRDMEITDVGRDGLRIQGGSNVRIERVHIDGTGGDGAVISGGDRISLRAAGHSITSSWIKNVGRDFMTPRSAIRVFGVGVTVSGNQISNSSQMAVWFDGNNHVIDRNVIHDFCLETEDSGAIYAGRDYTFRGTTIRGNLVVSSAGKDREIEGIYLDDMLSGTVVEDNVIVSTRRGVLVGGGRDNRISRNVFVDVEHPIHIDARALGWAKAALLPGNEVVSRSAAMPYRGALWSAAYPELASVDWKSIGIPANNIVLKNVAIAGGADEIEDPVRSAQVKDSLRYDHDVLPDVPGFPGVLEPCLRDSVCSARLRVSGYTGTKK